MTLAVSTGVHRQTPPVDAPARARLTLTAVAAPPDGRTTVRRVLSDGDDEPCSATQGIQRHRMRVQPLPTAAACVQPPTVQAPRHGIDDMLAFAAHTCLPSRRWGVDAEVLVQAGDPQHCGDPILWGNKPHSAA